MNSLETDYLSVLFDSNETDLTIDNFWKSIIGEENLLLLVELDNGRLFGFYLEEKVPSFENKASIQIYHDSVEKKHCLFMIDENYQMKRMDEMEQEVIKRKRKNLKNGNGNKIWVASYFDNYNFSFNKKRN